MKAMMGDADEEMKAEMKAIRGHADVVDDLVLMRSSTIPSDYGNYGYRALDSELASFTRSKFLISSVPLKLFSPFNSPNPLTFLEMEGLSLLTTNNANV
uniref:Uncharacterized protein n=1 Tax=Fagus sylvatica TaxID=28930 RepID=A0A2N9F1F5_FAGSY